MGEGNKKGVFREVMWRMAAIRVKKPQRGFEKKKE